MLLNQQRLPSTNKQELPADACSAIQCQSGYARALKHTDVCTNYLYMVMCWRSSF